MNPSNPPAYSMSQASDVYAAQNQGPPRWSALAITAFVLSLIGFLGFTAISGIIFAIAGIAVTRGGRRRGMGLAIAAIPIALVTGVIGATLVYGGVTFYRMYKTSEKVVPVLSASSDKSADGAEAILALGSVSFREKVDQSRLEQWLREVHHKHGNLAKLERDPDTNPITANSAGNAVLNLRGKFTNGPALMRFTFSNESLLDPRIDDIDVDGLSPRTPKGGSIKE
jgi:hypothetical protein